MYETLLEGVPLLNTLSVSLFHFKVFIVRSTVFITRDLRLSYYETVASASAVGVVFETFLDGDAI